MPVVFYVVIPKKVKLRNGFHLDFHGGQPMFHCFNCNRSGTFADLYSQVKGISISEALRELNKFDVDQIKKNLII